MNRRFRNSAAFNARSTGFQNLFSEDEIAFYEGLEELADKLDFCWRHDDRRRSTAEAGWRAAHSMFASRRIAKYILERSFAQPLSETYPWPTENTETLAKSLQQENSIA